MQWTPYPQIPWLFYAACGCARGGFYIHDQRKPGQTFHAPNMDGVHQYAADNSGSGLGSLVHKAAGAMGIKRCSKCARRQVAMNRWFT